MDWNRGLDSWAGLDWTFNNNVNNNNNIDIILIILILSQNIGSMAGLGFPPELHTQNANECMNSVLKRDTPKDKNRMSIPEFINHCRALEKRRRAQEKHAIIGRGELYLSDEHADLHVEDVTLFRKSEEQKKTVYAKFFKADARASALSSLLHVNDGPSAPLSHIVSYPRTARFCQFLTLCMVKEIFRDDAALLSEKDNVVSAPGP